MMLMEYKNVKVGSKNKYYKLFCPVDLVVVDSSVAAVSGSITDAHRLPSVQLC